MIFNRSLFDYYFPLAFSVQIFPLARTFLFIALIGTCQIAA